MKKSLLTSVALILTLAVAAPAARADDGDVGAAAALGFFFGLLATAPRADYAGPPVVVHAPPVVIGPAWEGRYYAPRPAVRYYRYHDYGRARWHDDGWQRREWRRGGNSHWGRGHGRD